MFWSSVSKQVKEIVLQKRLIGCKSQEVKVNGKMLCLA